MAYETSANVGLNDIEVKAYGGTRRQRAAKIANKVGQLRRAGTAVGERIFIGHDEVYGFMEMTTARYRKPAKDAPPVG